MPEAEVCGVRTPPWTSTGTPLAFLREDLVNGQVVRPRRILECHSR
jgi:hypothetical protein